MDGDAKRNILWLGSSDRNNDLINALQHDDWNVVAVDSVGAAERKMRREPFKVGIGLLPEQFGLEQVPPLEALFRADGRVNWVVLLPETARQEPAWFPSLQRVIAENCFDYHAQPIAAELVLPALGHAYRMADMASCVQAEEVPPHSRFGMIGSSAAMQKLYRQIARVCTLDEPVLISGETGTGKELVATAIHGHSPRAQARFAAINCASLPDSLIQSELFGYERGAFTGAQRRKIGRIEACNGGTLFLDEIGDLPLSQQGNLLRFLEEKTIVRVGGSEEISIDTRVIAATHLDLHKAVAEGRFREDLYYRLKVLQLNVPPLRERDADIEQLGRHFLHTLQPGRRRQPREFSAAAVRLISNHEWKGNVRELANVIRNALVMSDNRWITPNDLGLERRNGRRSLDTLEQARQDAERSAILASLRHCGNNVTQTAQALGVSRVTLHRLIKKYHLPTKS